MAVPDRLAQFLELAGSAYLSYQTALPNEKRDLLKTLTSNLSVDGKNVVTTLKSQFREIANRFECSNGGPYRDVPRTWDELLCGLWRWCEANPWALAQTPEYSRSTDSLAEEKPAA